jgi:hypothetical protein
MMIGDLIERFEDEAVATEAVTSLGDVALLADVATAAAQHNLTLGEFAVMSVGDFVTHARDDDWLTMFGRVTRAADPGAAFLQHILSGAVANSVAHAPAAPPRSV